MKYMPVRRGLTIAMTFTLPILMGACNGYKTVANEKRPGNKELHVSEVAYFGRDCHEFFGNIYVNKKVVESIVDYSCSVVGPVKILHQAEKPQYFIAVKSGPCECALTEEEKQLLELIERKNKKGKYDRYRGIIGFRAATKDDDLLSIPSIAKNNKRSKK